MAKLFDLEASGYFYTRLANPTNDAVARKIAALEGGTAGVLVSSGMAAVFYSLFNLASAGDHIVSSSTIYGGTFNLFNVTLKKMGIDVTFVEPDWTDEQVNAAFRPNTKLFFGETIANPALTVFDIERYARIAHEHGVPLIIDNTFPTPINCRPFEWGADIVVHSTTKYMDGHSASLGGCVVDSGKFDWNAHKDKFPGLTTPDESYHGLVYTDAFGLGGAYITKIVAQVGRDLGSMISPFNAYILNIGLETLALRMERHCQNAQKVAEWLEKHPKISWINYPGLESSKDYALAQKYMPNGTCGVLSFGLKGGRKAAKEGDGKGAGKGGRKAAEEGDGKGAGKGDRKAAGEESRKVVGENGGKDAEEGNGNWAGPDTTRTGQGPDIRKSGDRGPGGRKNDPKGRDT